MNVIKKVVFTLLFLLIFPTFVLAFSVSQGYNNVWSGDFFARKKYNGNTLLYCTQFFKTSPAGAGNVCSDTAINFKNSAISAGVAKIIENANNGTISHTCGELLIAGFLYEKGITTGREDYTCELTGRCTPKYGNSYFTNTANYGGAATTCTHAKTVYDLAIAEHNLVNAASSKKVTFDQTSLNFSKNSEGKYQASVNVTLPTGYESYECTVSGGTRKYYGTKITVTADSNTAYVSLTCKPKHAYKKAVYYTCGNFQEVASSSLINDSILGAESIISGTILGSFQIHKTYSDSKSVVGFPSSKKNFKFGLYSDSSGLNKIKEAEVNSAGNAYFNDVVPGIYYMKEIETKDGYQIDNTIYEIEIKTGDPDKNTKYNYKEIKNLTVCEVEFGKLPDKNNMAQRIGLYRMLKNKYSDANYRNVLNLSMTEAKDACSSVEPNYDYEYGCFSATTHIKDKKTSNSLSISSSNLSMYDDNYYGIYDASENGIKVFCSTSFNLENSIGSNFGTKKSGRPIIQAENSVAKGKLTRTCYAYVENNNLDIQNAIKNKLNVNEENAQGFYNNHINSVEIPDYTTNLDKRYKLPYEIQNAVTNVENEGILTKIVTIVETNYLLPYMYASNEDGRIIYSDSPTYGSNYKPIGKGLISRLNAGPGDYNFYIFVGLNNDIFGSGKESENDKLCSYTIENELIDNRNNINLEFRSVKTGIDNSFFSKTGSGTRKIGANWVGNENILKDNNDSYNKNNATEAKYSIILTPAIIEKIRDYNKTNKYDDYNFDCKDNGTICISNYLSKLKNEYGLEINTTNRTDYENIG